MRARKHLAEASEAIHRAENLAQSDIDTGYGTVIVADNDE